MMETGWGWRFCRGREMVLEKEMGMGREMGSGTESGFRRETGLLWDMA